MNRKRSHVITDRIRAFLAECRSLHLGMQTTAAIRRATATNATEARRALLYLESVGEVVSTYERKGSRTHRVWKLK